MDFEEFSYDSVEFDDFELNYYNVTLLRDLTLIMENEHEVDEVPVTFKKGSTFAQVYYLLDSNLLIFRDDSSTYEFTARVKVSIA